MTTAQLDELWTRVFRHYCAAGRATALGALYWRILARLEEQGAMARYRSAA